MDQDMLTEKVTRFFDMYEQHINKALEDQADLEAIAQFYSEEFIAASPFGVKSGVNDEALKTVIDQEYEYSRSIGTKRMECSKVKLIPLDDMHAVAYTEWTAVYLKDGRDISVPFSLHYLIQFADDQPKIFGWIAEDEEQLLKEKGIIEE